MTDPAPMTAPESPYRYFAAPTGDLYRQCVDTGHIAKRRPEGTWPFLSAWECGYIFLCLAKGTLALVETDATGAPLEAVMPEGLPPIRCYLPEGFRWQYRGLAWMNDDHFKLIAYYHPEKMLDWTSTRGRTSGFPDYHYAEAVPLEREPNHSPASAIRHALQGGLEPVSDAGSADAGEPPRAEGGTPRTDAAHAEIHREFPEHASDSYWCDFARTLERESNVLGGEVCRLSKERATLERESAELRAALAAQEAVAKSEQAQRDHLFTCIDKANPEEAWTARMGELEDEWGRLKAIADELRQTALAGTQG